MTKCDLLQCQFADRHFNIKQTNHNDDDKDYEDDQYFKLYSETMDALHFYVFHLVDERMTMMRMKM